MKFKTSLAVAALVLLSATVSHAEGDAKKGKRVFAKCKACHMVGEKAKKRRGPPLNNIIGAKAGAQDDYKYSRGMKKVAEEGLVWTEENLDAYLKKPKEVVPKGSMAFPGLKKETDRVNVIAYLKQFSETKEPGDDKKSQ